MTCQLAGQERKKNIYVNVNSKRGKGFGMKMEVGKNRWTSATAGEFRRDESQVDGVSYCVS